jgi:hypothetical protein
MLPRRALPVGFVDPCIPTLAAKPPSGPGWVHEIKYDGYRLIVRRDGNAVRLFTRRSHDWSDRYPWIAAVAAKLRARSFVLDGEAVVCGWLDRVNDHTDSDGTAGNLAFPPLPIVARLIGLALLLLQVAARWPLKRFWLGQTARSFRGAPHVSRQPSGRKLYF